MRLLGTVLGAMIITFFVETMAAKVMKRKRRYFISIPEMEVQRLSNGSTEATKINGRKLETSPMDLRELFQTSTFTYEMSMSVLPVEDISEFAFEKKKSKAVADATSVSSSEQNLSSNASIFSMTWWAVLIPALQIFVG